MQASSTLLKGRVGGVCYCSIVISINCVTIVSIAPKQANVEGFVRHFNLQLAELAIVNHS